MPDTPPIFGSPAVTEAARNLAIAVNALTREEAEVYFDEYLEMAEESDEEFDAAFLAAQMLRDLDVIDPEEALYIFARLLQIRTKTLEEPNTEAIDYYRTHGEPAIATLIVDDLPTYVRLIQDSWRYLFLMRASEEDETETYDAPASIALVAERLLTLASSAPGPEREASWAPLMESMEEVSVEAQVSAVRRLRDIGALTAAEHAALIDEFIGDRFVMLTTVDRQGHRRFRSNRLLENPSLSPFKRPERNEPSRARVWRIHVACLRQLGEHDLANLQLDDWQAYADLVEAGKVSLPLAAHPHAKQEDGGPPTDEDLNLVAEYFGRLMTDAEAEAFEERLREDDDFFGRVAPVVRECGSDRPMPRSIKTRVALRRAAKRMARDGICAPAKRIAVDVAEMELVRRYVDGEMDRNDTALFEAKLLADDAFYHRVEPYLKELMDGT